jgi:hypothetical protein
MMYRERHKIGLLAKRAIGFWPEMEKADSLFLYIIVTDDRISRAARRCQANSFTTAENAPGAAISYRKDMNTPLRALFFCASRRLVHVHVRKLHLPQEFIERDLQGRPDHRPMPLVVSSVVSEANRLSCFVPLFATWSLILYLSSCHWSLSQSFGSLRAASALKGARFCVKISYIVCSPSCILDT